MRRFASIDRETGVDSGAVGPKFTGRCRKSFSRLLSITEFYLTLFIRIQKSAEKPEDRTLKNTYKVADALFIVYSILLSLQSLSQQIGLDKSMVGVVKTARTGLIYLLGIWRHLGE